MDLSSGELETAGTHQLCGLDQGGVGMAGCVASHDRTARLPAY